MKRKQLLALVLVIAMMIGIMPVAEAESLVLYPGCDDCNNDSSIYARYEGGYSPIDKRRA